MFHSAAKALASSHPRNPPKNSILVNCNHAGRTIYFLISVLVGFRRTIVHWELHETMKELDIELAIAQGANKLRIKCLSLVNLLD